MNIWITKPKLRAFNFNMCTHSYHSLPESQSEEKLTFHQRMSLIETCFFSWLYGISLTFWQTVVRKYARAKVKSSRLKFLCVNVVHEHLHYTDLNHSAVEQYNRRSHSGGTAATAVSKALGNKSHRCGLCLWNSVWYLGEFGLLGSLVTTLHKAKCLCCAVHQIEFFGPNLK